jgi:hypothetical protein
MWTQQFTDLQQLWDIRSLVVRGGPQSPVFYKTYPKTQKTQNRKTTKNANPRAVKGGQGRLGDIGFFFLIGGLDF